MAEKVRIGEYSESHLLKTSKKLVAQKTKGCDIFDQYAEDRIPQFEASELQIGRVLGRGGFCVVSEITKVQLKEGTQKTERVHEDDEQDHHIVNLVQDRDFMQAHCVRGKSKDARYAIKRLSEDLMKDPHQFVNGIIDLAMEAKFLAVIRHANIIKMRAVGVGSPFSRDFFVVLDRLYDILSYRLQTWKKRKPGSVGKLFDRKQKKQIAFWLERITCAYDLACALKYLHRLNVVYRDLKPDNIGFDVRGDVKIFDLGLAREYHPNTADRNGCYQMTGDTGSTRYMAPEVGLNKPYNETVDVYSLAILIYQMLALEVPFSGLTVKSFPKMVYEKQSRPKIDPKWPQAIQELLRTSWSSDIKERPSMEEMSEVLSEEITANSEDQEVFDIMDASRKSEMSLRGG